MSTAVAAPPASMLMRAAVLASPWQCVVRELARPEPAAGQLLIRVEGSGVCASSIPAWEGRPWFEYPQPAGSPGHEGWGRVEALGARDDGIDHGFEMGDRVAFLGTRSHAEYEVVDSELAVVLPASLSSTPFPGEPLGCAMNIIGRSDIRAGDDVAIVGIGFLGAVLTRLVQMAGARVIAISRRPFSLDVAREFGAHDTIELDENWRVVESVRALTSGAGCPRVIEATGKQEGLDAASEIVAERGRLIIAGYHQDGLRQVNMQSWNWRGLDVINAHERDPRSYMAGMRTAVENVASGRLDPSPLYTHRYSLDELGEAMRTVRDRPDGFMKALVTT